MQSDSVENRSLSCVGFPAYEAGSDGTVWSLKFQKRKKLKPQFASGYKDYLSVRLYENGKYEDFTIAHLVLTAFVGPRPKGRVACHFPDRNPKNDKLSNLRWDTPVANYDDRRWHETDVEGERSGRSKLTTEIVKQLRRLKGPNVQSFNRKFAEELGVTLQTVYDIRSGKTWKFLLCNQTV